MISGRIYYSFKKTNWFWQNISFQNFPMENPPSVVNIAAKTIKEHVQHLNVPYARCYCVNYLWNDCWNSHLIAGLPIKTRKKL